MAFGCPTIAAGVLVFRAARIHNSVRVCSAHTMHPDGYEDVNRRTTGGDRS